MMMMMMMMMMVLLILLVNDVIDVTYLNSEIYADFRRLLCKKCDVGYYVINRGAMKLMITG